MYITLKPESFSQPPNERKAGHDDHDEDFMRIRDLRDRGICFRGFPRMGEIAADGLEQLGLLRHDHHRGDREGTGRRAGQTPQIQRLGVFRGRHPVVRGRVAGPFLPARREAHDG